MKYQPKTKTNDEPFPGCGSCDELNFFHRPFSGISQLVPSSVKGVTPDGPGGIATLSKLFFLTLLPQPCQHRYQYIPTLATSIPDCKN